MFLRRWYFNSIAVIPFLYKKCTVQDKKASVFTSLRSLQHLKKCVSLQVHKYTTFWAFSSKCLDELRVSDTFCCHATRKNESVITTKFSQTQNTQRGTRPNYCFSRIPLPVFIDYWTSISCWPASMPMLRDVHVNMMTFGGQALSNCFSLKWR